MTKHTTKQRWWLRVRTRNDRKRFLLTPVELEPDSWAGNSCLAHHEGALRQIPARDLFFTRAAALREAEARILAMTEAAVELTLSVKDLLAGGDGAAD